MQFGFCVMANIDEIGFFSHAETLGYDSVWVADSQHLFSDVYAVLALAAKQTSRIRLGPGTAICGTRIPAVQVAAMATLNRLAPGRVFLGIGTGNTAMRTMGQKPMTMRAFGEDFAWAWYWSINPLMVIFLTPFATALTRKMKPYPVIVFGSVISSLSVFAMAFSTTIGASVVFIVILSLGEILWSPRLYEYTATIAPRGRESSYMGLSEVPMFLAKPVAGVLSGLMLTRYMPETGARDPQIMWLIIGAVTLAAPVAMLFTRRWLEAPDRIG